MPLSVAVGLDAAGKTTILYKLKLGEIVTTIPTIGESRREERERGGGTSEDLLCILPQALISVQGADPGIRYCYLRSGSGYLYVQDEAGWM